MSERFKKLFWLQGGTVGVLGVLHVTALSRDLYWYYPWLDTVSHFLGGAWVAMVLWWACGRLCAMKPREFTIIILAIAVGVGWEVFEYLGGIPREGNWVLDTSLDLLLDVVGATCGVFFARLVTRV